MIVRISTEGQYELEGDGGRLGELDDAAVAACEAGDEPAFRRTYAELLEYVRSQGRRVDDDHLGGSDVILPPPDVSLEEARQDFSGEGLLPS